MKWDFWTFKNVRMEGFGLEKSSENCLPMEGERLLKSEKLRALFIRALFEKIKAHKKICWP